MEGGFTICVFQGKLLMGCVIFLPGLWWVDMFQPWGKGIGITRCSWLVSCLEQVHGFWPVSTELVKPPLKKSLHLALFRKIVGRLTGEEKGRWTQALKALKVRFWYITPFKKISSMCFLKERVCGWGREREKLVTLEAGRLQVSAGSKILAKMSRICLCTDNQYRADLCSAGRSSMQGSSF